MPTLTESSSTLPGSIWLRCRIAFLCLISAAGLHAAEGGSWVVPSGFQDAESKWVAETLAFDGSTSTYAEDRCNRAGNGPWLDLTYTTPITTDRVQIIADFGYNIVDAIDLEAHIGGTWTPLYSGVVLNDDISVIQFPGITVSAFRFRFHYVVNGYYFWLYDFRAFQLPAAISAPQVATAPASSVTSVTAVLHGLLNSDGGEPCSVRFQYRLASVADYTATAWQGGLTSGQGSSLVLTALSALQTGMEYRYRIEAQNSVGTVTGAEQSFTPAAIVPGSVDWISASGVTPTESGGMLWTDPVRAIDDDIATKARCYHPLWAVLTSPAIEFELPPIATDTVRLMAGRNPYIAGVTVWLQAAGSTAWAQVYSGEFTDATWLTMPLATLDLYTRARVVFTVTTTGVGTAWELGEFQVRVPSVAQLQLPVPVISPNGGAVAFPAQVSLTSSVSQATIRYTLDGSEPSLSSPVSTGTVELTGPVTLHARTFRDGWLTSAVSSAVFTAQQPPTIAQAATATPNPVTGSTTALTILGADDGGETNLTYTWSASGPASVAFSASGTNAAQVTSATFTVAGAYVLQATVSDAGGSSTTSAVAVSVVQTPTMISVAPATATVAAGGSQTFTAVLTDQFGTAIVSPTVEWSLTPTSAGTISTGGTLALATTATGSVTVTAQSGAVNGAATVTVAPSSDAGVTPDAAILSPGPGRYLNAVAVTVSALPAHAEIWITTDNSTPVPGSGTAVRVTGTIPLSATTALRAVAALPKTGGYSVSPVVSGGTYTIVDSSGFTFSPTTPSGSARRVSPACEEVALATQQAGLVVQAETWIGDGALSQMTSQPTVTILDAQHAYADIVLDPSAAIRARFILSDGRPGSGSGIERNLSWVATDLSRDNGGEIVIRTGDSLLLTASGPGSFLKIDLGADGAGESPRTIAGVPGQGLSARYDQPGFFQATAFIDGQEVGRYQVVVVTASIPTPVPFAGEVDFARAIQAQAGPDTSRITFGSSDPSILVVTGAGSSGSGTISLTATAVKNAMASITARIGDQGPIIRVAPYHGFRFEAAAFLAADRLSNWNKMFGDQLSEFALSPGLPIAWFSSGVSGTVPAFDQVTSSSVFLWNRNPSGYVFSPDGTTGNYIFTKNKPALKQRDATGMEVSVANTDQDVVIPVVQATLTITANGSPRWVTIGPDRNADGVYDYSSAPMRVIVSTTTPMSEVFDGSVCTVMTMNQPVSSFSCEMLGIGGQVNQAIDPIIPWTYAFGGVSVPDSNNEPAFIPSPVYARLTVKRRFVRAGDAPSKQWLLAGLTDYDKVAALNYPRPRSERSSPAAVSFEVPWIDFSVYSKANEGGVALYSPTTPAMALTAHTAQGQTIEPEVWADDRGAVLGRTITIGAAAWPIEMRVRVNSAILPVYSEGNFITIDDLFAIDVFGVAPVPWGMSFDALGATDDGRTFIFRQNSDSPSGGIHANFGSFLHCPFRYRTLPSYAGGGENKSGDLISSNFSIKEQVNFIIGPTVQWGQVTSDGEIQVSHVEVWPPGIAEYNETYPWTLFLHRDNPRIDVVPGASVSPPSSPPSFFAAGKLTGSGTAPGRRNPSFYAWDMSTTGGAVYLLPVYSRDDDVGLAIGMAPGIRRPLRFFAQVTPGKGLSDGLSPAVTVLPGHAEVNPLSGNLCFTATVQRYRTPDLGPQLTFTYNSTDGMDCGWGPGWRSNYDVRLIPRIYGPGPSTFGRSPLLTSLAGWDGWGVLIDESGKRVPLKSSDLLSLRPTWATAQNLAGTKTADFRAGEYIRLVRQDNQVLYFDQTGWLTRIATIRGDHLVITRDATSHRVTHVTDERHPERSLNLTTLGTSVGVTVATTTFDGEVFPLGISHLGKEAGNWSFTYDPETWTMTSARLDGDGAALHGDFRFADGANALVLTPVYLAGKQKHGIIDSVQIGSALGAADFTVSLAYANGGSSLPDAPALPVACTDALGGVTTFTAGTADLWTSLTDPVGLSRQQRLEKLKTSDPEYKRGMIVRHHTWTGPASGTRYNEVIDLYDVDNRLAERRVDVTAGATPATQVTTFAWTDLRRQNALLLGANLLAEQRVLNVALDATGTTSDLVTSWRYYAEGRRAGLVEAIVDPCNATTSMAYDSNGYLLSTTDRRGKITRFTPDAVGLPRTVTSPLQRITTITGYTASGLPNKTVNHYGYATEVLSRDAMQRPLTVSLPGTTTTDRVTGTSYDPLGNVTATTDVEQRAVEITRDRLGREVRRHVVGNAASAEAALVDGVTVAPPAASVADVLTTHEPLGDGTWRITVSHGGERQAKQEVDALGRLRSSSELLVLQPLAAPGVSTECETRYLYHPESGFPLAVIDPRDQASDPALATLKTLIETDAAGRQIGRTTPALPGEEALRTTLRRNVLGWVLSSTLVNHAQTTTIAYDACGHQTVVTNPAGGWTQTEHDADGRVTALRSSSGAVQRLLIDDDGAVSGSIDPWGVTTLTEIDKLSGSVKARLRTRRVMPSLMVEQDLDARGFAIASRSQAGDESTAFAASTAFRRDGSVSATVSSLGAQSSASRDSFGRAYREAATKRIDGADVAIGTLVAFTPGSGRVAQATHDGGLVTRPVLDAATGQTLAVSDNALALDADATAQQLTEEVVEVDRGGRVLATRRATGSGFLTTSTTYDGNGRMITQTTPVATTTWVYRGAQLASVTRSGKTTVYSGYNALNQVTSMTAPGSPTVTTTTSYDLSGRVLQRQVGSDTWTTVYDARTGAVAQRFAPDATITPVYDAYGRHLGDRDRDGRGTLAELDDRDRVKALLHADGRRETFTYLADTSLIATRDDGAGTVTTNSYGSDGILDSSIVTKGSESVTTTYRTESVRTAGGTRTGFRRIREQGTDVASTTIDRKGRVIADALPGQPVVATVFDLAGRRVSQGSQDFTYNARGQMASVSQPGVGSASLFYAPEGWLSRIDLPHGVVRIAQHDEGGRIAILTQTINGTQGESWMAGRDTQGRVVEMSGTDGSRSFSYAQGRLARERRTGTAACLTLYRYDGSGNRTAQSTFAAPVAQTVAITAGTVPATVSAVSGTWTAPADGQIEATGSDARAAMTQATTPDTLVAEQTITVAVVMPASGISGAGVSIPTADGTRYRAVWQRRAKVGDFGGGAEGRLAIEQVTTTGTVTLLASSQWGNDAAISRTLTVTHQPDGWLSLQTGSVTAPAVIEAAAPGIGALPTRVVSLEAAHDSGGSATAVFTSLSWSTCTERQAWTAQFNTSNQLVTRDEQGTAGTAHEAYAYTAAGDLESLVRTGVNAKTVQYGYDLFHRQTSHAVNGAAPTTYAYLMNGWQRKSITAPTGDRTTFTWQGDALASSTITYAAYPLDPQTTTFMNQGRMPLAHALNGEVTTYGRDLLGDLTGHIGLASASTGTFPDPLAGSPTQRRKFATDAFGVLHTTARYFDSSTGITYYQPERAPFSGFGYKGMWHDATGDIFAQHRYYQPGLGRFTQQDPKGYAGSPNLYNYPTDPIQMADPTGLDWVYNNGEWTWDGQYNGQPSGPDGVVIHGIARNLEKPTGPPYGGITRLGAQWYEGFYSLLDANPAQQWLQGAAAREAAFAEDTAQVLARHSRIQAATKVTGYVSAGIALVGAPFVAPALVPTAASGPVFTGVVTAEIVGGGFGAADAALDPRSTIGDVVERGYFGAATSGAAATAFVVAPPLGKLALSTGFVGLGTWGTYDSFSEGNYAQGFVRGGATLLGANKTIEFINPRWAPFNYEPVVLSGALPSSRAGGTLRFGFSYVGPKDALLQRAPQHHVFPQANREWFATRGVNIDKYTLRLDPADHSALHYGQDMYGPGGWWNATIMRALYQAETAAGRPLTPREILYWGARIRREAVISDVKVEPYGNP